MVDFHSHILPEMDDGSQSVEMSLEMLRMSKKQGINTIFSTSHFYGYEESPAEFTERRNASLEKLLEGMKQTEFDYPKIVLGAEVYYFPGMSDSESLSMLKMGNTNCILIEPPMLEWSSNMLEEIEQTGINLHCIPVIAHIDRYIRYFDNTGFFDRIADRKMLVQANSAFFLSDDSTSELALEKLRDGKIAFLGSDCHDTEKRPPNLAQAKKKICEAGYDKDFELFNRRIDYFLNDR